jgi:hypothetical protein
MTATLTRIRVSWALARPAPPARHFAAAQGAFLALLRARDPDLAQALHDLPGPKPYALSPLIIGGAGGQCRATLTVGCWDDALADVLQSLPADAAPLDLAGVPGLLLDSRCIARATVTDLLADAASDRFAATTGDVHVAFTTPTCFSLGKLDGGPHRYAITPEPIYLLPAWWRRWRALGGAAYDAPAERPGEWLSPRVVIRRIAWRSETIRGGKSALTGGTGRVTLAWASPEPWGPALLAALARCAAFTGTGAKTTQGMGQTALAPPEDCDAHSASRRAAPR